MNKIIVVCSIFILVRARCLGRLAIAKLDIHLSNIGSLVMAYVLCSFPFSRVSKSVRVMFKQICELERPCHNDVDL